MRRLLGRLVDVFSSVGLACVLLLLLALLTWLGTLAQVDEGLLAVQRRYFESYVLVEDVGGVPVPLPGGNLVLSLLFVNLITGGIVRLHRSRATAGVLLTHVGVAWLLVAAFVKLHHGEDGQVTLLEGGAANVFQSHHRWEIALARPLPDGSLEEHLIPQEDLDDALDAGGLLFTSPALPFDVHVRELLPNCRKLPEGPLFDVDVPVVDGAFLSAEPTLAQAEANVAGAYVDLVDDTTGARRSAALWGRDPAPLQVPAGGTTWSVSLRKERHPLPFTLVLDDFTKVDHPRTAMPAAFSSDVTVVDELSARPVHISMNAPLREQGFVVYQASWGPSNAAPGDPLFSTLAVVRNPADRMPLQACLVIAAGLLLHFSRRLVTWVHGELRAR